MPLRKKSQIALTKIPCIQELCDQLGFRSQSKREISAFINTIHGFRQNYKTREGQSGADLIDWKSPVVQQDLYDMAVMYLESGNGDVFRSRKVQGRKYSYPQQKEVLAQLLKQLFWKQNKYAYNNTHHRPSLNSKSETRSSSQRVNSPYRNCSKEIYGAKITALSAADLQPQSESPQEAPKPQALSDRGELFAGSPDQAMISKPKIRGVFWIITSSYPLLNEELWKEGTIQGKCLSLVVQEVSNLTQNRNVRKLRLKIKTPFVQTTATCCIDDEDKWSIIKKAFTNKIKEAWARIGDQLFQYDVYIEPIYATEVSSGGI